MHSHNRKYLITTLLTVISVTLLLCTAYLAKQNISNQREINILKQSYKYTNGSDNLRWARPNHNITDLLLSPSILQLVSKSNFYNENYQCINTGETITRASIKQLILGEKILEKGLDFIENNIYTTPMVDENGNTLQPFKSRHEIAYSSICMISEDEYVAIFLTTKVLAKNSNLAVSKVIAGGGWTGNSHMAVISKNDTKIYERFPFTAKLINLPKHPNGIEKIGRFMAYYRCKDLVMAGENYLIIECSENVYAFDKKTENFSEISICGNEIDDKHNMLYGKYKCYDRDGKSYINRDVIIP